MENPAWFEEFPGAITVTDGDATVIAMNKESANVLFKADGGYDVLGRNAITCHPPRTQPKVREIYENHAFNIYSITKGGQKYLVYQAPYFVDDNFNGIVELFLRLPEEIPHFDRDNPEKK